MAALPPVARTMRPSVIRAATGGLTAHLSYEYRRQNCVKTDLHDQADFKTKTNPATTAVLPPQTWDVNANIRCIARYL
jgi:hypothetical protein